MATGAPVPDSTPGYRSEASKRRFTILAGVLGAVFFLAQFILPMVAMVLMMGSMALGRREFTIAEVDKAALWHGEVWLVAQTAKVDFRDVERSTSTFGLQRLRLNDLTAAGPTLPLDVAASESSPSLVPIGDRLWVIGTESVGYYERGTFSRLTGKGNPGGPSRPFPFGGQPAVLAPGSPPILSVLNALGGRAQWEGRAVPLDLPADAGALRALQAVEAGGRLHLVAQLCTEEPSRCEIRHRALDAPGWLPLAANVCSCATWRAIASGTSPAVVVVEREREQPARIAIVTADANGARREPLDVGPGRLAWNRWSALVEGPRLVLLSEGMPGNLRAAEVAGGRIVRSVRTTGSFPFGPSMLVMMTIPQLLPIVLSLVFAGVLTIEMRRHRIGAYEVTGPPRAFASLWQRALAQLVDLVPFMAGFAVPISLMWRMFSDPESLVDSGSAFPFKFIGLMLVALAWALVVLVVYSYFEGRSGKTPGKWLVGIRVLGTDLQPCGFGRALLRNLLTFVDGFFNFLVGALMVALTENWQRLGDLAARTIVVVDEKPA